MKIAKWFNQLRLAFWSEIRDWAGVNAFEADVALIHINYKEWEKRQAASFQSAKQTETMEV